MEWWIQGVGFFKTDGSTWVGIGEQNKDIDVTDADGMANVWLKSIIPGQTIVHCKVMDKYGLPWKEWNVVKQWYSIDRVEFIDAVVPPENGVLEAAARPMHPESVVGTGHSFTVQVAGAKYVYVLVDVNMNGLRDDQALIGDREDMKWSHGVILGMDGTPAMEKPYGVDVLPGQVFVPDINSNGFSATEVLKSVGFACYTRMADVELADNEFWSDGAVCGLPLKAVRAAVDDVLVKELGDGIREIWAGLEGKNVCFFTNVYEFLLKATGENCVDWTTGTWHDQPLDPIITEMGPMYVGEITSDTMVVTDEMGMATVEINSLNKGYQFVLAVADYPENPQDGVCSQPTEWNELRWDAAAHLWLPDEADPGETAVWGQQYIDDQPILGDRWVNPVLPWTTGIGLPEEDLGYDLMVGDQADDDSANPNRHIIAVQVFDQYGNALEGYKVTWEIVGQGTTTQGAEETYHPYAHFAQAPDMCTLEHDNPLGDGIADRGDLHPFIDNNPIWDSGPSPYGDEDDDWAWGWTLNHQIDFTLDLMSAAHATLVLDETATELDDGTYSGDADIDHFTNIVNVKVYTPTGALFDEFEVTKVWTLEPQSLSTILLEQSIDDVTYGTGNITDLDGEVYYRMTLLDQFGNAIANLDPTDVADLGNPADKLYLDCDVLGQDRIVDIGAVQSDGDGYIFYDTSGTPLAGGVYTATYWLDADGDNQIDAGEMKSNSVVVNVVITTPPNGPVASIATTSGGTAAEATVSANIPAGTADDDLMLALVESYQSSGTPVQPSTVPTGWSLIATQTVGECNFSVYYKVASGDTPGTSRTWGYAGIKDYIATNIVTYRGGFSVASPIQGSSNTAYTNADLILRAASVTTSAPQTNLILVGGAYLSGTFRTVTPPADFTEDLDWAPASPYFLRYFAHSTAPQAAAGASGDKDATMSGSGSVALKHAVLIALNP